MAWACRAADSEARGAALQEAVAHGGQIGHRGAARRRLARNQALRQRVHRPWVAHAQLHMGTALTRVCLHLHACEQALRQHVHQPQRIRAQLHFKARSASGTRSLMRSSTSDAPMRFAFSCSKITILDAVLVAPK